MFLFFNPSVLWCSQISASNVLKSDPIKGKAPPQNFWSRNSLWKRKWQSNQRWSDNSFLSLFCGLCIGFVEIDILFQQYPMNGCDIP